MVIFFLTLKYLCLEREEQGTAICIYTARTNKEQEKGSEGIG